LADHPTLTQLLVSGNNIGAEGVIALSKNNRLLCLAIASNKFGKGGLEALARNQKLTSLDVGMSIVKINEEILGILSKNRSLSYLNVDYCGVNTNGVKILASMPDLTGLSMKGNHLSDPDGIILARSESLKMLNVGQNKIGKEGIEALARNPRFTSLDVRDNPGNEEAKGELLKMLNGRIKERREYASHLRHLLSLLFSGEGLTGSSCPSLPLELEGLIFEYCKFPGFTLGYIPEETYDE
jgi:hypothetical protein